MSIYESPEVKALTKRAIAQAVRELDNKPRHLLDPANPNHPDYDNRLFGYNEAEFLAKQYRA